MAQKNYSDSQYGVEKILGPVNMDGTASAEYAAIELDEDLLITEIGVLNIDKLSAAAAGCVVTLQNSNTIIGSISIPSETAAGTLTRQTTITNPSGLSSGDILVLFVSTAAGETGSLQTYVKYRQRYIP